ncbi:MAG: hypothetical protein PHR26_03585 [Candidatus ainarchaeum sp.]|nr:hypothetical protein [Candidatus ainarchaeum sp.]MDD3976037.1 hypothetical protein [Candidatus ainarchaeum sp.]
MPKKKNLKIEKIEKYSLKNPKYETKEKAIQFLKLANKLNLTVKEEKLLDNLYNLYDLFKKKFEDSVSKEKINKLLEKRKIANLKKDNIFDKFESKQDKEIFSLINKLSIAQKDRLIDKNKLKEINFYIGLYFSAPKVFSSKEYSKIYLRNILSGNNILKDSKSINNTFYKNIDKYFIEGNRLNNYLTILEILNRFEFYDFLKDIN